MTPDWLPLIRPNLIIKGNQISFPSFFLALMEKNASHFIQIKWLKANYWIIPVFLFFFILESGQANITLNIF